MSPLTPLFSWLLLMSVPCAAWLIAKTIISVDAAHTRWRGPVVEPFQEACVCGHDRTIHEHHRRGTDCAGHECGCRRYEPELLGQVQR